jgi:hypothetical protein
MKLAMRRDKNQNYKSKVFTVTGIDQNFWKKAFIKEKSGN